MEEYQTEQNKDHRFQKGTIKERSELNNHLAKTSQTGSVRPEYLNFMGKNGSNFFDGLPIAYLVLDGNGVIKYVNQAAAEFLGITPQKLINREIAHFVHEADQKYLQFDENSLPESKSSCFDIRITHREETLWARANVWPIQISPAGCRQVNLILCDMSDLKKREQEEIPELKHQLQQTQKMAAIGVLSSGIAHDFNNILHPIIGSLEMLIEDTTGDRKLQSTLKKILAGAGRASNLVKQILSFSHQKAMEVKPVKIQPIIREVLKLSRSTLPANIKIIRTIDKACGPVTADPTHIYQIAMNLITNAFHAMGNDEGTLDVMVEEVTITRNDIDGSGLVPGVYACLSVADTGQGMDQSVITRLFEPYFTTKEEGTGLGLCVISQIVQKYGGDICCYSEPGEGSVFRVYLPVEPVCSDIYQGRKKAQENLYGTESILFVDDDPFIVEVQKETLERSGYTVTPFVSSLDALNEFKAHPVGFDIVICDMNMPGLTGLALAEKIKLIRPDIPIVICTGFSDQIDQESYLEKGINGFLTKPAVREESLKLIRHLLNTTR